MSIQFDIFSATNVLITLIVNLIIGYSMDKPMHSQFNTVLRIEKRRLLLFFIMGHQNNPRMRLEVIILFTGFTTQHTNEMILCKHCIICNQQRTQNWYKCCLRHSPAKSIYLPVRSKFSTFYIGIPLLTCQYFVFISQI